MTAVNNVCNSETKHPFSPGWISENRVALLFGITGDHTFALANILIALKRHCPRFWRQIIVYHEGLGDTDKAALSEIESCEFIHYEPNFKKNAAFNEWAMNMYSMLMFARYEAFRLIGENEYDAVLWSDVDVLIRGDISPLVKPGAIPSIGFTLAKYEDATLEDCFFSQIPDYDATGPMFNSGLMVVNRDLREKCHEIYKWLNEKTGEYAQYLKWPDQGMLNLMLRKFKIIPTRIDLDMYHKHPYWDADKTSVIVHSHGPEKFWNWPDYWKKYPEWRKNHRKWIRIRRKYQTQNEIPVVSVVIPTLNAGRYLRRALTSVLEQTLFEQEIIIVDGGSQDNTLGIIASFDDGRVRVIDDSSGGGIAASLNIGVKAARGKYIARMDADDISLPGRFASQCRFLEKNPNISACGSWAQTFQKGSWLLQPSALPECLDCHLVTSTPFVHPSMMWRAEDFTFNNLWYDETFTANEDFELWQRASEKIKFSNIPQPLLCYRLHDGNGHINEKTRKVQILLMDRAFKKLGISFSQNALLLLDQRDNSFILSDAEIALAMTEIYRGFLCAAKNNARYDKRALAWHLLCHLRWIYFERARARGASKRNFNHTAMRLGWFAKAWFDFIPDENFGDYRIRLKHYWKIFKASPLVFTKKVIRKLL